MKLSNDTDSPSPQRPGDSSQKQHMQMTEPLSLRHTNTNLHKDREEGCTEAISELLQQFSRLSEKDNPSCAAPQYTTPSFPEGRTRPDTIKSHHRRRKCSQAASSLMKSHLKHEGASPPLHFSTWCQASLRGRSSVSHMMEGHSYGRQLCRNVLKKILIYEVKTE